MGTIGQHGAQINQLSSPSVFSGVQVARHQLSSPPVFCGVQVAQSLVFCVVFRGSLLLYCPFVLFLLTIVCSVLHRITDSDYPLISLNSSPKPMDLVVV